jgi:hypothetical protein
MSDHDERIELLEARIAELESARRPRRRRLILPRRPLVVGLLAVGLLLPGVALASHQFSDVPDSHPFHDDISAIAGAGITSGFSDGTYRPSEPVTRMALAAFLRRTGGRAALAIGAAPMTASVDVGVGAGSSSDYLPVRQLTITVAGASNDANPNQLVHLQGRVQFFTSMSTSVKGCPCTFVALIRDVTTDSTSTPQFQTFESGSAPAWFYNFDVEALFAAPPGPRTYELEVALNSRAGTASAVSFGLHTVSSLSATTFPFGPTGTNTVSAAGALNMVTDVELFQPQRRRDEE